MTPTRRGFLLSLVAGAAGLGVAVSLPGCSTAAPRPTDALSPNVWVHLAPDGSLTLTCHRAEMGQGIRATLPWIIAAELGADYDRVVVEQAIGDPAYGDQNTDGSTSIREQLAMLREAGAAARHMLVAAAAARWGVDPGGLVAEGHAVTDPATGRSLGFGELALDAVSQPIPDDPPLRPTLAHAGRPMPFTDARAIVTGAAVFGADPTPPGLRYAAVARPPVLHGKVASFDDTAARAVPGVVDVVELPAIWGPPEFQPVGGVAVVATNTWAALKGRDALQVTWDHGENADADSRAQLLEMTQQVEASGREKRAVGDADAALDAAAEVISATYTVPHLSHAQMEPLAAVAWVQADTCEVWAPVQSPVRTRDEVASAVGLSKSEVTVHQTLLGGAFGRKSKPDFVVEAAIVSKAVGAPVKLQWDRQDDMRHGYYHACAVQKLDAGLDAGGAVVAWRHRVASPTIGSTFAPMMRRLQAFELGMGVLDLALDVPNVCAEVLPATPMLRIGWMRSVYNINHGFAIQSFVDELARKRGVSTPAMLKQLIGPPRLLTPDETGGKIPNYGADLDERPVDVGRWHRVIDDVVARSGFEAGGGPGRALGFAAHASFGTYVAVVVAVTKGDGGRPRVDEAWVSVDAGQIMNPDRATAQMEGAVVFGASIALHGEISVKGGAVEQSNYHDYPVARMNESPRAVHVSFVDEGELPGGIGEPGVPPVAPAIANAWAALTGERVRRLPIVRA